MCPSLCQLPKVEFSSNSHCFGVFFDLTAIQKMQHSLFELTGISSLLTDINGNVINEASCIRSNPSSTGFDVLPMDIEGYEGVRWNNNLVIKLQGLHCANWWMGSSSSTTGETFKQVEMIVNTYIESITALAMQKYKLLQAKRKDDNKDVSEIHCFEKGKVQFELIRSLMQHNDAVRENERLLISRELHDELGQVLTTVKMELELFRQNLSGIPCFEKLDKIVELIKQTIKTVQRISVDLRPNLLDELGLDSAIEWYTNEYAAKNSIIVKSHIENCTFLCLKASLIVFRVLQESLSNILRHAHASVVEVELYQMDEMVYFSIKDNGVGIQKKIEYNNFGIMGMKERAISIGGTLEIYNVEEGGAKVELKFPIK